MPGKRYGIDQKTVAKGSGATVADLPTGPREAQVLLCCPSGTEAIIAAFRRPTLLLLDDCLYALQATIPS